MSEALQYAKSITYLRCPQKVRRHTLAAYGTAPAIEVCERLVDAHTAPERRFREMVARRQMIA